MNILEARSILRSQLPRSNDVSRSPAPNSFLETQQWYEAADVLGNPVAYRELTIPVGQSIAREALEFFDTEIDKERYLPQQILTNLANIVPGSLAGLYPDLLKRDLGWDSDSMFREADPASRDAIIAQLESGRGQTYTREDLLCALAWIGDEAVQSIFKRWRDYPPSWRSSLSTPPENYADQAGWELTDEGTRRNLYHGKCYDLIPIATALPEAIPGPVTVGTSHEERCGWCGRHLFTLFDFDVRDRRLSFLWPQGRQVRIAMCMNCTFQYAFQERRTFTDVDGQGTSRWSAINGERPSTLKIYEDNYIQELTPLPQQIVLGSLRRTPYDSDGLHIGGCPDWVQDADYPRCPICQRTMQFIGQHEPKTFSIEGVVYAFLCRACGKATIGYQQT